MRILFLLLSFAAAFFFSQWADSNANKSISQVKQTYRLQLNAFAQATDSLFASLHNGSPRQWQPSFRQARLAYKQIEFLADYYYPSTAKAINGPPVPEVEADDIMKVIDPSGFQVMEERLFPQIDTTAREELLVQARMLQSLARRLQNGLASLELTDAHVFDALRLHLLRMISIGFAGGDNGIAQNSISEAVVSLQSMRSYLSAYAPDQPFTKLLSGAVVFLQRDTSFTGFNRAAFIVSYARPIWHGLYQLQTKRHIPFLQQTGLVNTRAPQLFDSLFFNAASFSGSTGPGHPLLVQLGQRLFADNRLSGNGTRSCATCHQPQQGYANNQTKNSSLDGKTIIFRNTPTTLYAALQPLQFADGRLSFLEDQAKAVIENHSEMRGNLTQISARLSTDSSYRKLARQVYGRPYWKEEEITAALAAFIRSQAPFRSPFDAYLRGDEQALTPAAIKGFNLFMGKGKCGTCHFLPLFNGVVPPHFSKMESEVIGVPNGTTLPAALDPDEGKYRFTGSPIHRFAFKTPTLRNVALTAPYMHNGVYRTLEEVVDFYDKGGAAGLQISLPNQTLPAAPLQLTREEKKAIIQFLQALTDR